MSNRNKAIESVVNEFTSALKIAGAIDGILAGAKETKPLYYRGIVPKIGTKKEIWIVYTVTDNLANTSSDNSVLVHNVYIDFVVYTRKAIQSQKFVDFVNKCDDELHKSDFFIDYGMETFVTDDDTDTVISGKPITVNKLYMEE